MLVTHTTQLVGAPVAGLLFSPIGISLFGIFGVFALFGPIALVLLVANLFGGRSRSTGDPSGIGIVAGLGVLVILSLAIAAVAQ